MQTITAMGGAHWMYVLGVLVIVLTMIFRSNVVVPSIVFTFLVTLVWSGSPISAIGSIFTASFVAAKELFNIFLVIALMTALLNALKDLRSDVRMVQPFRVIMTNGHTAYLVLIVITYLISLFFWPTPAVPLVAAVLLPAAIAAGLPPLPAAVAIAIAGQGMALSSDYVIGVAPGISAKAAGAAASASVIADRALVLSLITGAVALVLAYLAMRKQIQPPGVAMLDEWQSRAGGNTSSEPKSGALKSSMAGDRNETWSKLFAVLTPLAFLGIILLMVLPKFSSSFPDLKGGAGASLIGGTAAILMMLATWACHGARRSLDVSADHVTDGLVFAFKAMGSVLPIAGFFFVGAGETAGPILGIAAGAKPPELLFEAIKSAEHLIPHSKMLVAFGVLVVGMVTGIDGSGFSGLPLTGALSGGLAPTVKMGVETLAAVGQMGAIWTGGGTLIAWSSLIAVAGFARVSVVELVRVMLIPVITGLVVSTIAAVLIWG